MGLKTDPREAALLLEMASARLSELADIDVIAAVAGAERGDVLRVGLASGWSAWLHRYSRAEHWTLVAVSEPGSAWGDRDCVHKDEFFASSFPAGFVGKRKVQRAYRLLEADAKPGSYCFIGKKEGKTWKVRIGQIAAIDPRKGISHVFTELGEDTATHCGQAGLRASPVLRNKEAAAAIWFSDRGWFGGWFGALIAVSSLQKRLAQRGEAPWPQTAKAARLAQEQGEIDKAQETLDRADEAAAARVPDEVRDAILAEGDEDEIEDLAQAEAQWAARFGVTC